MISESRIMLYLVDLPRSPSRKVNSLCWISLYPPGLSPVAGKELRARFDGGRLSSDGGVLLFPGIERRLGIADSLASRLHDERNPASATHSYADMDRARMFAVACGGACPRAGQAEPGGGL